MWFKTEMHPLNPVVSLYINSLVIKEAEVMIGSLGVGPLQVLNMYTQLHVWLYECNTLYYSFSSGYSIASYIHAYTP